MLTIKQKKQISKWIYEAQKKMLLSHYDFKIVESDKPELIDTATDIKYLRVRVRINSKEMAKEWKEQGSAKIREHCYHEVVHTLLARMDTLLESRFVSKEEAEEASESTTEQIMRIILW